MFEPKNVLNNRVTHGFTRVNRRVTTWTLDPVSDQIWSLDFQAVFGPPNGQDRLRAQHRKRRYGRYQQIPWNKDF